VHVQPVRFLQCCGFDTFSFSRIGPDGQPNKTSHLARQSGARAAAAMASGDRRRLGRSRVKGDFPCDRGW
jgi:hypothetical protein